MMHRRLGVLAILNGKEVLNLESLNEALSKEVIYVAWVYYNNSRKADVSKAEKKVICTVMDVETCRRKHSGRLYELLIVDNAKAENKDLWQILKIYTASGGW